MRIGEYLILEKLITQADLDNALALQKNDKTIRIGEVLVKNGIISKNALNKCIFEFMKKAVLASDWLSQVDVDDLFSQYKV